MAATTLKGYLGKLYTPDVSGTYSTQATGAAVTLVTGTTYQITDEAKRIIDPNAAIIVYDDAAIIPYDGYSISHMTGKITLDAAPGGTVTITYKYMPALVQLAGIKGWTVNIDPVFEEVSEFGDTGSRMAYCGVQKWTASLDKLAEATQFFFDELSAHERMVLCKFFIDGTNGFWGWGVPKVGLTTAQGKIIQEKIDITGCFPIEYF